MGLLKQADEEDVGARVAHVCECRRRRRIHPHRAQPLRRFARGSRGRRAARWRRSTCPPCARISWSTPTRCSKAALAGAGGVLAIMRMLPRAGSRAAHRRRARAAACSCCSKPSTRRTSSSRTTLVDARRAHQRPAAGRRELARPHVTLKVVPGRLDALAPQLPTDVKRVAESGVATAEDAARMAACGYDLALVGSALMSAPDPAALARAMLAAGARGSSSARCRPRMNGARKPFIKICGMTTPRRGEHGAGLRSGCDRLRVRDIGASGDDAARQRARGAGARQDGLRGRDAPSDARRRSREILRDFKPDILQTDIDDIAGLDLPQTLSRAAGDAAGPAAPACALPRARAVRRAR